MYYSGIIKNDTVNGPGFRISIFVSGCTNRCDGCFNPQTWDFQFGSKWTKEAEAAVLNELAKPYYKGITILGGEPFEIENQKVLDGFISVVRKEFPEKTIWVYTGNCYDDLLPGGRRYLQGVTDNILSQIDVLVDGKFDESKKDLLLYYRGSSNQRIINVPETRKTGTVILSEYHKTKE